MHAYTQRSSENGSRILDCCTVTKSCPTLCDPMDCSTSHSSVLTVFPSLLKFISIESVTLSNHLILYHGSIFFSCLQSFPESGSFPVSQLFASGGQIIGTSVSASVLPMNMSSWFPIGLTGLISFQSKGLSRVFSNTTIKPQFFGTQPSLWSNSHIHTWLLEKPWIWLCGPLSAKCFLCFLICCLDLS